MQLIAWLNHLNNCSWFNFICWHLKHCLMQVVIKFFLIRINFTDPMPSKTDATSRPVISTPIKIFLSVSSISSLFSGIKEIAFSRLSKEASKSRAKDKGPYFFAAATSRSVRFRKFSLSAITRRSWFLNSSSSALRSASSSDQLRTFVVPRFQ